MLDAIHQKAPNAKVYLLGYPDPLPRSFTPGNCPALEHLIADFIQTGIVNQDLDYLNSIIAHINTVVESAASAGGATYVPPDPTFAKHGVCSTDPWFFPLTLQNNPIEILHPNQAGHRVMEQDLFTYAGPAPD